MPGTLIVCSTPIGNLGDASPRLSDALRSADLIYAEDTRRTRVLLSHLGVATRVRSFFVGNEEDRAGELEERLAAGAVIALVTDAGTPGIADPGVLAVRAAERAGAVVTLVPGPSAVTAAIAVAGFAADRFTFEGFLPRKGKARSKRLAALAAEDRAIVLFAATRRVGEDLAALAGALGRDRQVVVARELTKIHEEVWRGTLGEAAERWQDEEAKGEFTIVVAPGTAAPPKFDDALAAVRAEVDDGKSLSAAVRSVAEDFGVSRRQLYEAALRDR